MVIIIGRRLLRQKRQKGDEMMIIGRRVLLKQVAVVKMALSQVEKHWFPAFLASPVISFVLESLPNF